MSTPRGRTRRAVSLGDGDPRHRRDPQAATLEDATFEPPVVVDEVSRRVGLKPCPNVAPVTGSIGAASNRNKINEILAALKEGGIMEG